MKELQDSNTASMLSIFQQTIANCTDQWMAVPPWGRIRDKIYYVVALQNEMIRKELTRSVDERLT